MKKLSDLNFEQLENLANRSSMVYVYTISKQIDFTACEKAFETLTYNSDLNYIEKLLKIVNVNYNVILK